ncbi:MAG: NAD-dependent epimerase/dehydratase family protein [Cytophagales bacterium]|nr:NAD-dependent epimerase/dehydratase family protein [Cytophagales bacterium]
MTNILITGGAGFIGSSLAEAILTSDKYYVVLVDNLLTGSLNKIPLHERCKFIQCDVNDFTSLSVVMKMHHFDYVFHYAAVVGVKRTLANPVMVLQDVWGIRNVLDLSKETGVKRVFYSSSSEVYGEPTEFPQHEHTTPLNSRLPYAVVKNVGESFCRAYQMEFNLPYTIFRFFNTYGPRQTDDFVMSKFIHAALAHEPITIYGTGNQTRTFCHIRDNTECVKRILEESLVVNDVINIGSEKEVTILDLAKLIVRLTGSKSPIRFLPPLKEGDMTRRLPNSQKMKLILGGNLISLEEGIQEMIKLSIDSRGMDRKMQTTGI